MYMFNQTSAIILMNHDIGIHALHPQSSPLMATLAFALALNQHDPDIFCAPATLLSIPKTITMIENLPNIATPSSQEYLCCAQKGINR